MSHGLLRASLLTCAVVACTPTMPLDLPPPAPVTPGAVDCDAAEQGIEFFPYKLAGFDDSLTRTTVVYDGPGMCRTLPSESVASARFFYSYTDGTNRLTNAGYQPRSTQESRCIGHPDNNVLHMSSFGPFLGWGGGMGMAMSHMVQDMALCPIADIGSPTRPSYCSPEDPENDYAVAISALNLSEWDGIAVWARRGPTSQPLLRMVVGTKDTDDDIAFLMYDPTQPKKQLFCQRVRDCSCQFNDVGAGSTDHECIKFDRLPADSPLQCATLNQPLPFPGYYCGRPGATPASFDSGNNSCNTTQCDSYYAAFPDRGPDPQFAHKPCTPTTYRSGAQTSLCRNPDEPVVQTDQQCGDHFTYPLRLSTEWKLYLVPFKQMFQQGFAKQAATFDLKSVSVVRLTWDAGPIDYYVDDLRVFRYKRD